MSHQNHHLELVVTGSILLALTSIFPPFVFITPIIVPWALLLRFMDNHEAGKLRDELLNKKPEGDWFYQPPRQDTAASAMLKPHHDFGNYSRERFFAAMARTDKSPRPWESEKKYSLFGKTYGADGIPEPVWSDSEADKKEPTVSPTMSKKPVETHAAPRTSLDNLVDRLKQTPCLICGEKGHLRLECPRLNQWSGDHQSGAKKEFKSTYVSRPVTEPYGRDEERVAKEEKVPSKGKEKVGNWYDEAGKKSKGEAVKEGHDGSKRW